MTRGDRIKKTMDRILSKRGGFARDVSLVTVTQTPQSLGNLSDVTESAATVTADFHTITEKDRQILERGIARIGDAKLYLSADITVNEEMFVDIDSVRWQFRSKIEPDDVNGVAVAQVWIIARSDG